MVPASTLVTRRLSRAPFRLSARAAGATRAHIRIQFVSESVLLAGLGGIGDAGGTFRGP